MRPRTLALWVVCVAVLAATPAFAQEAKHVSLVPQLRVLYVPRGNTVYDSADTFATLGINQVTTRIGVSVRATF